MTTTTVSCGKCGRVLNQDPGLPVKPLCPHCGSRDRAVHLHVADSVMATDSVLSLERVREYVQRNPFWTAVLAVLVVGSAVASWLLSRWIVLAVAAALVFAVIRYLIGPRASARVIEREKIGPLR